MTVLEEHERRGVVHFYLSGIQIIVICIGNGWEVMHPSPSLYNWHWCNPHQLDGAAPPQLAFYCTMNLLGIPSTGISGMQGKQPWLQLIQGLQKGNLSIESLTQQRISKHCAVWVLADKRDSPAASPGEIICLFDLFLFYSSPPPPESEERGANDLSILCE